MRMSTSLDPAHAGHFVRPDLGQTFSKGYQLMSLAGKELKSMWVVVDV